MALLVWFTIGVALWHFTVFLPDRFWQGIVGAFLGAVSARSSAAHRQVVSGGASATPTSAPRCRGPGRAIGLAIVYAIGVRAEPAAQA